MKKINIVLLSIILLNLVKMNAQELCTEDLTIDFTKSVHGGISSIRELDGGCELLGGIADDSLFAIEIQPPGSHNHIIISNKDCDRIDVQLISGKDSFELKQVFLKKIDARLVVTCRITTFTGDKNIYFKISVKINDDSHILSIRYPVINLAIKNTDYSDDMLAVPTNRGALYPAPSRWRKGETIVFSQPLGLAAQFFCYYNRKFGILSAVHDSKGYPKTLIVKKENYGVQFIWEVECYKSKVWEPDYAIALALFHDERSPRNTDWRDGASIYKEWAVKQSWCSKRLLNRSDIPSWLLSGAAMVRFPKSWLADPAISYNWINYFWKKEFSKDIPLIVVLWGWENAGSFIPFDYFPPFPSESVFGSIVDCVHSIGGHVFLWPSGFYRAVTYSMMPYGGFKRDRREEFKINEKPHSIVDSDQSIHYSYQRWLYGGASITLCPGDAWTTSWSRELAKQMAIRGIDMIQLDQVVGGYFPPCYSMMHGHPSGPGPWMGDALRTQISAMREEIDKLGMQGVLGIEGPNEHFIQDLDIQDYRDWEAIKESSREVIPAPVFNYVYHEYILCFQSNPVLESAAQYAYSIVNGEMPHIAPSIQQARDPAIIKNRSFDAISGNNIIGWERVTKNEMHIQTLPYSLSASGKNSLCIIGDRQTDFSEVYSIADLPQSIDISQQYRFSVWAQIKKPETKASIGVSFINYAGDTISTKHMSIKSAGIEPNKVFIDFYFPVGTVRVKVFLSLDGEGVVLFDEVSLASVSFGIEEEVVSPIQNASDKKTVTQWIDLYRGQGREFLLFGEMQKPPMLECNNFVLEGRVLPTIMHNMYVSASGRKVVIVANATNATQMGILQLESVPIEIVLLAREVKMIYL